MGVGLSKAKLAKTDIPDLDAPQLMCGQLTLWPHRLIALAFQISLIVW